MQLPTLYKKTSTGKIQMWSIAVQGREIAVRHGQVDGKIQETKEEIKSGKNLGKTNATTPEQQAELEAEAKHEKQRKKGYVDSIEKAQAGEVDEIIEGGYPVMLAPNELWPKRAHKMTWPAYIQPKLDGERQAGIVEGGVSSLWTRSRKRIKSLPHIEAAIAQLLPEGSHKLDGEAYADKFSEDFEELMSIVRKDYPDADGKHRLVQYWLYDYPSIPGNFGVRYEALKTLLASRPDLCAPNGPLVLTPTWMIRSIEEVGPIHERNMENGDEGSMIRKDGPYEGGRRSDNLQKVKDMQDAEFPIIGAEEGRGKDAGTVGAFVCVSACRMCENGRGHDPVHACSTCKGKGRIEFRCRLKASYARRRELFQKPELWRGKRLTIKYQKLSAYGIPIFLIGKAIREPGE